MNYIYNFFQISKQAYFQARKKLQSATLKKEMLLQLAHNVRKRLPKVGGRKLYKMLKPDLEKLSFQLGRDGLFRLLRENQMLIRRKKKYAVTTNSHHWYKKFPNLIKELKIISPNQVWVSDITYIRIGNTFGYLSLITDYYSRKIVGFHLHKTLEAVGCITALNMALKFLKPGENVIHHSDRGIQYCCYEYIKIAASKNLKISMTEDNHVYENALAERVNGILKDEFFLDQYFINFEAAEKAITQAVETYNSFRPHLSLNYATPDEKYAA